jgi:hypothetical protein
LRAVHKACWLLVKQYAETSVPAKPMHRRENPNQIEAPEHSAENLTRAQQVDFVPRNFPGYRVTQRSLIDIFRDFQYGLEG